MHSRQGVRTCQHDELSAVLVAEAVRPYAGKNMSRELCNVSERDRSKLVILSNGQRQHLLLLNVR